MKKNNGFTLIELLSILVILAIIALIATPIITNLIKNTRLRSAENAVQGLYKAVDVFYGRQIVNHAGIWYNNNTMLICFGTSCNQNATLPEEDQMINGDAEIENSGLKPIAGIISVDRDGKIEVIEYLKLNNFYCTSSNNERDTIKCTEEKPTEP